MAQVAWVMSKLLRWILHHLACGAGTLLRFGLEGRSITLFVTEGEPGFSKSIVTGKIVELITTAHEPSGPPGRVTSEGLLILLSEPWRYTMRTTTETKYVIVEAFFHAPFCALIWLPIAVRVFPSAGSPPYICAWKDMIAICDIRRSGKCSL